MTSIASTIFGIVSFSLSTRCSSDRSAAVETAETVDSPAPDGSSSGPSAAILGFVTPLPRTVAILISKCNHLYCPPESSEWRVLGIATRTLRSCLGPRNALQARERRHWFHNPCRFKRGTSVVLTDDCLQFSSNRSNSQWHQRHGF
ncbi:uncharacterized protein BDZ83DRAFT_437069 [Colletotrichum acutatum]|uniref:Uncharacterized protein n=1 Tax=Glomerella acutata TaxID=27357 RepID=A0AAD8UJ12_GLOAC|nr:uncharacterized protein BDZ83DRAFT_437069 [Colletotrichum acutatum]KAK1721398.1 hypothetical protein BDZ83DRAFT_437069 [Colletotrichum acutatum]